MYKLKRSGAVKVVVFLLTSLFLFCTALNAVGVVYLVANNAFDPAQAEGFTEKAFDNIYASLAYSHASRLAQAGVTEAAVAGEGELFLENHPSFQKGSTNFAFTVKDADGNVLLQNYTPQEAYEGYTLIDTLWVAENEKPISDSEGPTSAAYSEVPSGAEYSTEAPEPTGTTAPSTEAASVSAATTAAQPPTNEPSATEPTTAAPNAAEPTSAEPTRTEQSTAAPDTTETTRIAGADSNANALKQADEEVYILDERDQGYESIFMYIYPAADGIDEAILERCENIYHDEYLSEEAVYYLHGRYEVFHQADFAVSSNGSVYFIGTPREDTGYDEPQYLSENYYIEVKVDKAITAHDSAYYVSLLASPAERYLRNIVGITVFCLLAALFFGILSLVLAGFVKGEEAPVARGIHNLPMEIVLAVFITALSLFAVIAVDDIQDAIYRNYLGASLFVFPFFPVLLYWCVYTFTVRCKAHTLGRSFLVVRLWKAAWKLIKAGAQALSFQWKLAIALGVIYVGTGIAGIIFLAAVDNGLRVVFGILFVLFMIALLAAFLLLAINLQTLYGGAKDLSEGKGKPIANTYLFGEFKRHAEHLNSINDGINAAVEERLKSETTKTELITNVSHDLKTPLTSIVNYIDLLKKEEIDNPKAQEYIEVLDRQSQRLKKLTTDIVDASKAAAGSIQMTPERIDLNVLLGQMKGEYAEKLAEKGLVPVETLPEESPMVWADGKVLWRVFDNLMSNVCKYSMPNTRVYLTLTVQNGFAAVEFKNISEQPLNVSPASLTDRFVRGDASRNSEGSGLGLNIAQSLAQNMGGNLYIAIDGDLFKATVTIPLAK